MQHSSGYRKYISCYCIVWSAGAAVRLFIEIVRASTLISGKCHLNKRPTSSTRQLLFMISLSDLASANDGRSMDDLLVNYINTLMKYKADFKRWPRKLVVVLTKGDAIRDLPANLRAYLLEDPIWAAINSEGTEASRCHSYARLYGDDEVESATLSVIGCPNVLEGAPSFNLLRTKISIYVSHSSPQPDLE